MGQNYGSGSYGHFYERKGFSARICPGCRCKQRKCSSCGDRPSEKPSRPIERSVDLKKEDVEGTKE
ncbi:hypothetical protein JCM19046_2354 [Bacillus sp. JCM 19046]|uniref:Uncharacterized protein n=1 Tax=Shouchella xiaoxiensis TaxID=766895 RepID=A0ABS2SWW3_9BACI|nr:hypothetical protein [Shouchella xiaoxiensis]MBM7840023.1 hypothetical protein [Shouchella xiaoxiensis]GAF12615.1 hypothetical protein JCM19045_1823 [Bacillus sp. JCM 19045]GAF17825.1 hypothetical protein JCM19046_2354 [Bacillus sp. JCM 19046]